MQPLGQPWRHATRAPPPVLFPEPCQVLGIFAAGALAARCSLQRGVSPPSPPLHPSLGTLARHYALHPQSSLLPATAAASGTSHVEPYRELRQTQDRELSMDSSACLLLADVPPRCSGVLGAPRLHALLPTLAVSPTHQPPPPPLRSTKGCRASACRPFERSTQGLQHGAQHQSEQRGGPDGPRRPAYQTVRQHWMRFACFRGRRRHAHAPDATGRTTMQRKRICKRRGSWTRRTPTQRATLKLPSFAAARGTRSATR